MTTARRRGFTTENAAKSATATHAAATRPAGAVVNSARQAAPAASAADQASALARW